MYNSFKVKRKPYALRKKMLYAENNFSTKINFGGMYSTFYT